MLKTVCQCIIISKFEHKNFEYEKNNDFLFNGVAHFFVQPVYISWNRGYL